MQRTTRTLSGLVEPGIDPRSELAWVLDVLAIANRAPTGRSRLVTARDEHEQHEHQQAGHDWPIMKVLVHVKEKCIPVSVGNGDQPVRWLANVGIARHDDNQGRMLGLPVGVKAEDGSMLNMDSTLVAAQISDMQHVWVHFKGA